MPAYTEHNFYCMKCGNKGIPLSRKKGHQHQKHHRKKLYCITCKEEVNHIECKNLTDVQEFKQNFAKGVYLQEAEESVQFVQQEKGVW